MKDGGERTDFETGSVRDTRDGKGRFDLIPFLPLENLAKWYGEGAKKYASRNWEKGQPLAVYVESAFRHLAKFVGGMIDEDHMSACVWNLFAYQWTAKEIVEGRLPYSLTKDLQPDLKKVIDEAINPVKTGGYVKIMPSCDGNCEICASSRYESEQTRV
jgi:hypothetical protein